MFYNELFESVIKEASENYSSQLFERVLREANESEIKEENKAEELIFLEDLVKMTNVLSTKKTEIITHNFLGDIVLYAGETNAGSYGLKHIICDRMMDNNYNKTDEQITAILALIGSALHDGKPIKSGDRLRIIKNGIAAIVDNKKTRNGQEILLLTGYDLVSQKKEATGAIQTVNAQYSSAPEYSGLRKQVVAVTSEI